MPKRYQATSNVEDYWKLLLNWRANVLQFMRPHGKRPLLLFPA